MPPPRQEEAKAEAPKPKPVEYKPKESKPMWAKTEKQLKNENDEEAEELIEFAYELDYEKYVEDMEVRQALALIKDRVAELKGEDLVEKRKELEAEREARREEIRSEIRSQAGDQPQRRKPDDDTLTQPDWNQSTKSEAQEETEVEKIAGQLADKVLYENPQIKGVHSKQSLKQILAKEAQRQLEEV